MLSTSLYLPWFFLIKKKKKTRYPCLATMRWIDLRRKSYYAQMILTQKVCVYMNVSKQVKGHLRTRRWHRHLHLYPKNLWDYCTLQIYINITQGCPDRGPTTSTPTCLCLVLHLHKHPLNIWWVRDIVIVIWDIDDIDGAINWYLKAHFFKSFRAANQHCRFLYQQSRSYCHD